MGDDPRIWLLTSSDGIRVQFKATRYISSHRIGCRHRDRDPIVVHANLNYIYTSSAGIITGPKYLVARVVSDASWSSAMAD
jgi:hypothetical protein